jgi:hypothetical protein
MLSDLARTKSSAFLRDSTRNPFLRGKTSKETHIHLSLFPRIENLWLVSDRDEVPAAALEIPPLKQLYCDLEDLYRFGSFQQRKLAAAAPGTHWTGLVCLPHLTHLAFDHSEMVPLCIHIQHACKTLWALLILDALPAVADRSTDLEVLADDPRFVVTRDPTYPGID